MLGHKRQIHEEIALLKARKKQYEEAYTSLKEAHDRSIKYVNFIDDMYRHEIEDVWERNRMLSYEVLYQRLLDITTFGKTVTSTLTRSQLIEIIQERLPQIFKFDVSRLLLYNEKKNQFQSLDMTIFLSATHPVLQQCINDKEAIVNANIQEGDAICGQLGSLYEKSLRSIFITTCNLSE